MRVLFQINGTDQGGVLSWLHNSSIALSGKGIELHYACYSKGISSEQMQQYGNIIYLPYKPIILMAKKLFGIPYYSVGEAIKNKIGTRQNSKKLTQYVLDQKIDIIVTNGYLSIPHIKIKDSNIKIYTFIHTTPTVDNTPLKLKSRYIAHLLQKVNKVFVVGELIKDQLQPYTTKKIIYFPNATKDCFSTDPKSLLRIKYKIPIDAVNIGSIGRFTKDKGYKEIIETFELLAPKYSNLHCILAGEPVTENDQKYYDKVLSLIDQSEFKNRIHLVGIINNVEFYSLVNIFYLFRINSIEAFGLVVIEAMSAGIPVIAPNIGGPKSIIEHGRTGFLVNPGAIEEYAEFTSLLIDNMELRRSIIAESRKLFENQYSVQVWGNCWLKMCNLNLSK